MQVMSRAHFATLKVPFIGFQITLNKFPTATKRYSTIIQKAVKILRLFKQEQASKQRPFRVSVEGNISSGKTTFMEYFQHYSYIDSYVEPVDQWRDVDGNNLLHLLYTDIKRWNFLFTNYVQLTRFQIQTTPPSSSKISIQMYERCVQNNRFCFVEMAYKHGYLNSAEYAVLDKWYQTLSNLEDISIDLIVYIRTKPETCLNRMVLRARTEESPVSLVYLQQLHEIHENWLMTSNIHADVPILVINAEQTAEDLHKHYMTYSEYILGQKLFKGKLICT